MDGHGGTMLANIVFIGASVKPSQVNFLFSDHPLSTFKLDLLTGN
jgi:hypothetical protein